MSTNDIITNKILDDPSIDISTKARVASDLILDDQEREALQAAAQVYEASKHPGSYTRVTPQTRRDTQAVIDAYHAALAAREAPSKKRKENIYE
jgi:hypothetical protein